MVVLSAFPVYCHVDLQFHVFLVASPSHIPNPPEPPFYLLTFQYGHGVACKYNADVVFALDASGSIEKENFFLMEDYVRDIIYGLNIDGSSRVGVLTFGNDAKVCLDYLKIL